MKNILGVVIAVVVIIAAIVWFNNSGEPEEAQETGNNTQQQPSNNSNQSGNVDQNQDNENETDEEESDFTLEGTLQNSNDKNRGNLMLLLTDSDRVVYFTTARDFSKLVGEEVVLTIDGTLDSFTLLDIEAKSETNNSQVN